MPLYLPEEQRRCRRRRVQLWLCNYGLHPESGMLDSDDGGRLRRIAIGRFYRWEGRRLRLIGVATLRDPVGRRFLAGARLAAGWQLPLGADLSGWHGIDAEAAIFDERQEAIQAALMGQDFPTAHTRDRAALYSLDSEDSAALTTLPQGAALQVLKADCGRDGTWARVLYAPGGCARAADRLCAHGAGAIAGGAIIANQKTGLVSRQSGLRLSKNLFRQPADASQLKQTCIGNVIFL